MAAINAITVPRRISANGARIGIPWAAITVIVDVAALLAAFVSGFDVVTEAVLETAPGAAGSVSVSEIVTVPRFLC